MINATHQWSGIEKKTFVRKFMNFFGGTESDAERISRNLHAAKVTGGHPECLVCASWLGTDTSNFAARHTLSSAEISQKVDVLDQFWTKSKLEPSNYVPAPRQELADFQNSPFFPYDGSDYQHRFQPNISSSVSNLWYKSCVMPSTRQGSFQLFRFAGIDVFLHWSWFVVAALEISARGRGYPSIAWNIAEYLALFLIVTLHEFGHALACRQVGGTANKIMLWPLGGVAYVNPPPRPAATLWSIAAGPLVNVVLLGVSAALAFWGRHAGWRLTGPHAYKLLWAVCVMNLGLLVFNLLPIYPLDGGQILRSLLWFVLGRARSLKVVAVLGLLGALGLITVAFWLHSFWLGLVSVYMVMNCWTGLQEAQILSRSESPALRGRLGEEYTEITDPSIQSRVRARHNLKIAPLQALGFQHFAYRLEALPPYSAISKFPVVLMMFSKEVLVFPKPARLGVANILLTHSTPSTIAECLGLGVKFYSVFSDGTLLISSSYRSPLVPPSNSRIIKNPHCQNADEAWIAHRQKAAELGTRGLTVRNLSSFADYVEIERIKLGMVIEA